MRDWVLLHSWAAHVWRSSRHVHLGSALLMQFGCCGSGQWRQSFQRELAQQNHPQLGGHLYLSSIRLWAYPIPSWVTSQGLHRWGAITIRDYQGDYHEESVHTDPTAPVQHTAFVTQQCITQGKTDLLGNSGAFPTCPGSEGILWDTFLGYSSSQILTHRHKPHNPGCSRDSDVDMIPLSI